MECKKCGIPIICECGCMPMLRTYLDKLVKNKEINYTLCGEACRTRTKEQCIKCNSEFEITHGPQCPKCGIGILDTECFMNDIFQNLENEKQIIYIVGKTTEIIDITCVKCGTKFRYDRNKGVVK